MPMKPTKMICLLKKNGFHELPKQGGHRRFADDQGHFTEVPLHAKELRKGIQDAILKQAGLK